MIGSTVSDQAGFWRLAVPAPAGRYYAAVRKVQRGSITCGPGRTRLITVG
jgi:hypothetical protein